MFQYEGLLWSAGARYVAGVDEARMSPLTGPVSAAAVIFAPGTRIVGVDDSKKLDTACHERLAGESEEAVVRNSRVDPRHRREECRRRVRGSPRTSLSLISRRR
jgi:ribonuclease HII